MRKLGKGNICSEYFGVHKYLLFLNYSQLFGEEDADQEVSPDRADPEASWEPMEAEARARASSEDGDIKRVSTRNGLNQLDMIPLNFLPSFLKMISGIY